MSMAAWSSKAVVSRACGEYILYWRGSVFRLLVLQSIGLKNVKPMNVRRKHDRAVKERAADFASGRNEHAQKVETIMPNLYVLPRSYLSSRTYSFSGDREIVMGLRTRLYSRQYGQQCRNFALVCGAGAQASEDVYAIRLFESPWRWALYPCSSALSSCHGQKSSGQRRCSSYSSVWKTPSVSGDASVDSGEAQTIERLWEEYCADPSQWWDNRVDKSNPRFPDFTHKVTKTTLWVDSWSTPLWAKAMLKLVTQGRSQSHAGYGTRDYQDTAQGNRLHLGNNRKGTIAATSARERRENVQGGGGTVHVEGAGTMSEAIGTLRNRLVQGTAIDSYKYVEVLKRCLKQKGLGAAKQVHECINNSGMEQNTYVANTLLSVYIRCGRLHDARGVFDKLAKKDVFSWTSMIGGYAQHNCGKDAMEVFNKMCEEGPQPNEITYLNILKACASPSALNWGKEVHAHIRHGGLEADVRVGAALLKMYAACGCMEEARQTFERLTNRNVITWTAMIGAYAESGCGVEAYRLFLQMEREGLKPNAITYLCVLKACAIAGALEWVKEVHRRAHEAGFQSDMRVNTALVRMYAKSGSIDDARLVFDRMEERDVITWNVIIGAYAESGRGEEAYRVFLQMERDGFKPDAITYMSILNACASAGALEWVKEVHRHAREAGFESDVRVGTALVRMYAKSGSIDDARLVFDRMGDRNEITWNTMIGAYAESGGGVEAYRVFLQMERDGFKPNAITYLSILNAFTSAGALEWVKEVHKHAREAGFESDVRVGNALVHMYAKCGSIGDARLVFDRMEDRNIITWNAMVGAYAESGRGEEAYRLFLQMQRGGLKPDAVTYMNILNACASAGALEWLKDVHRHAREGGFESDVRVGTALVRMYAMSGSLYDARLVFDKMEERNEITWSVMMGAYAESGCGVEAYELFLEMEREGLKPNAITYLSILNACASAGALEWVRKVHRHAREAGFESDLRVANALVHMYAKSGSVEDARLIFDRMKERDVLSWTVMIGGLAQHGFGEEALEVFRDMVSCGVKPNGSTFVAVLSACSHSGLVEEGRRLFLCMTQDYGMEPDVSHCNCMVDLLGRAGLLEEAKVFIRNMPVKPDEVTWGAMLGACRTYGNVELGEVVAGELLKLVPKDASTYVLLSNIYAAAGKWEEVSLVRRMMQERGIRKQAGRSWIEVDNKMHEFVVGDTSHEESEEIYKELNRLTEEIKGAGYIPDTRLVLNNIDEEDKELALCSHSEKLAIAYGLLRIPGGEPIRVYKNLRVCSDCHTATKFISKVTGREIVARDANRFHHFKDGVCSCNDYW